MNTNERNMSLTRVFIEFIHKPPGLGRWSKWWHAVHHLSILTKEMLHVNARIIWIIHQAFDIDQSTHDREWRPLVAEAMSPEECQMH